MNILVINAGSSSLKYQLIDMATETVLAKGNAERIGGEGSNLRHRPTGKPDVRFTRPLSDHKEAIKLAIDALMDNVHGVITSIDEISAVGHRVVHGGEQFSGSVIINDEVMEAIYENVVLAPLHNPANIMGIKACKQIMPNTPMVAVFDTAFHQTMSKTAYLYAIPYEMYLEKKIRKYGFHGSSHRYVVERAAEMMGRPLEELKLITCHLGNGSSICAVDGGKSVDTSMGMTPLEGLIMGTRCGDLDPAIVQYIMESYEMTIDEVMDVLNKKSGFIGLSQFSSDMRDVLDAAIAGNAQCKIAVNHLEYGIKKYVGAYAAIMNGVDAVVFTAGIGENNPGLRKDVIDGLSFLGLKIDEEKNMLIEDDIDLSAEGSKTKTLLIATNEELMIARDTLELTAN